VGILQASEYIWDAISFVFENTIENGGSCVNAVMNDQIGHAKATACLI